MTIYVTTLDSDFTTQFRNLIKKAIGSSLFALLFIGYLVLSIDDDQNFYFFIALNLQRKLWSTGIESHSQTKMSEFVFFAHNFHL